MPYKKYKVPGKDKPYDVEDIDVEDFLKQFPNAELVEETSTIEVADTSVRQSLANQGIYNPSPSQMVEESDNLMNVATGNQNITQENIDVRNRPVSDNEYEYITNEWATASKPNEGFINNRGTRQIFDDPKALIPENQLPAYDAWVSGKSEEEIQELLPPAAQLGFDPDDPELDTSTLGSIKYQLNSIKKIAHDLWNVDSPQVAASLSAAAKPILSDIVGPEMADAYFRDDYSMWDAAKNIMFDEGYSYMDPDTKELVTRKDNPERFKELQEEEDKIKEWEERESKNKSGDRGIFRSTREKTPVLPDYLKPKYLDSGINRISDDTGKVVGTEGLPELKESIEEIDRLESLRQWKGPRVLDMRGRTAIPSIAAAVKDVALSYIPQIAVGTVVGMATKSPRAGMAASTSLMAAQMGPDMLLTFNEEKAKRLYPELSKADGIVKLKEEGKWETARPMALLPLALGMEQIGFKGITKAIAKNPFSGRGFVSSAWAAAGEGGTEVSQLAVDLLNTGQGMGLNDHELGEFVKFNWMDQAPEVFAQAAVGTFFLGQGGQATRKAYKTIRDHTVPHTDGTVANAMISLGNLRQAQELATDPKVKKGIKYQIKATKDYIVKELKRGNKLGGKLTDRQIKSLDRATNTIEESEKAINELEAQNKISSQWQFTENTTNKLLSKDQKQKNDAAIDGYKNSIKNANNSINRIAEKLADQKPVRNALGKIFTDFTEVKSIKKGISQKYIEDKKRLEAQKESGEISDKQFKADSSTLKSEYDAKIKEINDSTSKINKADKDISKSNIIASENTQKLFEDFLKDKEITKDEDGKFVFSNKSINSLKKSQEGLVNKVVNSMFAAVPESMIIGDKRKAKSLFKANVENALFELLRSYKPSKGVPLAAWLQTQLPRRAKRGFKGITNDKYFQDLQSSAVQGMIAEEDSSIDPYVSNIETANELGIDAETMALIKNAAKKALLTSKEKVDNLKFKSDISKSFANDLYKTIKQKLGLKNTKSNQGLTRAMEEKPQTFYNTISVESMRKARGKDKNGNSINPFEEAGLLEKDKNGVLQKKIWSPEIGKKFINYITDPDIGKNTRSDRQMSLIEALATSMAAREAANLLEQDIDFRQRFAEQQQQEQDKNIFEKAVDKIKSIPKGLTEKLVKQLEEVSWAPTVNAVTKILGLINKITVTDTNRVAKQKANVKAIKKGIIPSIVFVAANFSNFKRKTVYGHYDKNKKFVIVPKNKRNKEIDKKYVVTTSNKYILESSPQGAIDAKLPDGKRVAWQTARGSLYYGVSDPAYKTALKAAQKNDKKYKDLKKPLRVPIRKGQKITKEFIKKYQDRAKDNMNTLESFATILQDAVHKHGVPLADALLFVSSSYQATSGLIKVAAPFKYVSKVFEYDLKGKASDRTGEKYREEHNPPASVIGATLMWAIANNKVGAIMPSIRKNYYQTQLSKKDDGKLDRAKLGKVLPKGFSIINNPVVRLDEAKIDLNSIVNPLTGKTLAQENNVESPNTIDGIAASNEASLANNSDQVENLIDRAISKLTELTGSKGTLQMNLGAIPVNLLIGGLRTVKLAYQGGKTLAQAIDMGYKKIKDYMSAQEWADFVSKSTQEVKNEQNPAQVKLAILSEKGVAQMQEQSRKQDEELLKEFGIDIDGLTTDQVVEKLNILRKAKSEASNTKNPTKKARVFDFDDTLAKTDSKVLYKLPDGTEGSLDATQFAEQYESLKEAGATFDYSEFNKVKKGSKGPLANLAKRFTEALGDRDVFVVTARPNEAAAAIQEFLRSTLGISIPLKNITGLENGTPGAKALWIAEKVSEGYNDIFFADDSKSNVDAVEKMLTDLGVTNKVQQAKEDGQKTLEDEMDSLIRTNKPSKLGRILNKLNIYVPPGADDFAGLLSYFLGSGKTGEQQQKWFKENLLDPFAKGIDAWTTAKVSLAQDYKELKKRFKNKKLLAEKVLGGLYTKEQAVRAYLYNKAGQNLGLNKADTQDLIDLVEGDAKLKAFAEELSKITKLDNGYPNITKEWLGGNIDTDMANAANTSLRTMFLQNFINNKNQIFSDQNLKLIKEAYGNDFANALENILERMTTGINRKKGKDKEFNTVMNWINQSVGAVMAVNMRSAILQQLSIVNYTNWSFNNPFMMAKAMANVPQFLEDYAKIWNSPFLKERRGGMAIDVNMTDIADSNPGNLFLRMNKKILELGFKPTQWGDSNAISFGGAMWYRNKVNRLIKEGMSKEDAEAQAMLELRELSEEHQQSSRPDRISRQQSSDIGRLILAFANTPLQLARSTKKATGDLIYRRGDPKTNMSKIMYYGLAQSLIFGALQQGLFSLLADDDDEDEEKDAKKINYALNSTADGLLRGIGFAGATTAALKNLAMEYYSQRQQRKKGEYVRDGSLKLIKKGLTISPPISKKIGDIVEAQKFETWRQYKNDPFYKGFAAANYVSGLTNIPADRIFKKIENLKAASDDRTEAWQSIFLALGWSPYNVDVEWPEMPPKKPKVKKSKTKKSFDFGNDFNTSSKKRKKSKTPSFKKSGVKVLGRANADGSIEIAKGLSPEKRKQVEAHELKHKQQIEAGRFKWDRSTVTFDKKKYKRTGDGKIVYNGKAYIEGHPTLPWEKEANKVERQVS